jgi:PBP1b-binding outer membrane lipoprotein LpoB
MKRVSILIAAALMLASCSHQNYVYKRQGVLHYDGKNYKFEPTSNWAQFTPTKENDTLFQYVIVRKN